MTSSNALLQLSLVFNPRFLFRITLICRLYFTNFGFCNLVTIPIPAVGGPSFFENCSAATGATGASVQLATLLVVFGSCHLIQLPSLAFYHTATDTAALLVPRPPRQLRTRKSWSRSVCLLRRILEM